MANIKNFGIKGVASDVQMGKGGGFVVYDSANGRFEFKDSGSALENVQFATVEAGTWNGSTIGVAYGGTGMTSVAANSIIYTSGADTFATANITSTGLSILDSADAAAARTTLGLGNVATQSDNSIAFTGGTLDNVVIGGTTAAAGTFTTISSSSGITGDLTGNVTGNADTADAWSTARDLGLAGDATGNVSVDGSGDATLTVTLANTGVTAGNIGSATAIPVLTIDSKGRITATSTATIATSFDISDGSTTDTVNTGETLTFSGTSQIDTTVSNNTVTIGIADGASIANLSVTGTFTSDDITSSAISIDGDATITGNLTVQGTQTTVNSTTVETADAIFRTNSNGANTDAGFEANTASGVKQILYTSVGSEWDFGSENVKASSFEGALTGNVTGDVTGDVTGNVSGTAGSLATARDIGLAGDATGNVSFDGSGDVTLTTTLANTAVTAGTYGDATNIPQFTVDSKGRITGASNVAISTSWTLSDGSTSETVNGGDTLTVSSDSNTTATVSATDTLTIGLAANIAGLNSVSATTITDGTASLSGGALSGATTGSFSGNVSAGNVIVGSGAGGNISGVNVITANSFVGAVTGNVTGNLTGDVTGDVTGNVSGTSSAWATARDLGLAGDATGNVSIDGSGDATLTMTLAASGVTAGTVGSATQIPVLTIDAKGRVTGTSTANVSSSLTIQTDDAADNTVDLINDTLKVLGGTNITTTNTGDDITINLDSTVSGLTSVSATTVTDGTASMSGGALSGVTTVNTSGDVTVGGNLTVNGTTTTLSSTNTVVEDTLFELNGGAGSLAGDSGIIINRGSTGDNAVLAWDESADRWALGTTTANAEATGDLTISDAALSVGDVISSGTVEFADLSDGTITISAFVDEDDMNSDSATMVPTQQSVKAYVDSKVAAVDDTVLRASFTADSANSSFTIGTMPNTAGRTYIGSKLTLKISTAFSGDDVDAIEVSDGTNTLMAVAQNDPTSTGVYIVDLGAEAIAGGATVTASFKQSDGSTASTPTAGAVTATVEYQFVT